MYSEVSYSLILIRQLSCIKLSINQKKKKKKAYSLLKDKLQICLEVTMRRAVKGTNPSFESKIRPSGNLAMSVDIYGSS